MGLTIQQLSLIGDYLNIYLGSFMFIAGILGSFINIWLFTRRYFQKSPCSRFILTSSVFDIIHLISALFFRILADGFKIDPASSSVIGCRIRYYFITFSAYASVGGGCLAAFDRYACTSRSITLRQWSSTKIAYRFLICNVIIWACFALPNLFFFNLIPISPTRFLCHISKQTYSLYFAYFVNPVMYFALPLVIRIYFTIQTLRNLRLMKTTRGIKRLERQMTLMVILQALTNSISSIPYGIQFLYAAITLNSSKDTYRRAQEHLFLQITRLSYYINFMSAFYIYYISSQRIRSIIKCNLTNKNELTIEQDILLYDLYKGQLSESINQKDKDSNIKHSSTYDEN